MNDVLLSVAVITYNQEKFISQTLDSILSQKHPYSFEIVIGEDCSSDGTKEIIKKYVEKYPDVIKPLYNNPNKGLLGNYYNVLENCHGKYIMECAGDDYWLPGKVEKQIQFMENNPEVGLCYGKASEWVEYKECFSNKLFGSSKETFSDLIKGNDIPALSVCFRNDLIKEYVLEIKPLEKQWRMEDYPQWLWFSLHSKIHFFNEVFAVYRNLEESISHVANPEKQFLFNKNYYQIAEFFAKYKQLNYQVPSDAEIYFYIYWKRLRKKYNKADFEKFITFSKQMNKLSFSQKAHVFLSRIPLFLVILDKIKPVD